mgnify:CR=1 FL=1
MPKYNKKTKTKTLPALLIIGGLILTITAVMLAKNQPASQSSSIDTPPDVLLDRYLSNRQPVFLFFHSNNCQSCIDMIHIVNQVYPDYKNQIALMDINVYERINQNLIQRARVNTIPTQVFINNKGQGKIIIGVMEPDQLRQQLSITMNQ